MTRVFEALRRERERRKKERRRDPLAAEIGASGEEPKTDSEIAATEFELPSVIGSPVTPRSNDGMVLPLAGKANGVQAATPGMADVINGRAVSISASPTAPHPNNSANGNSLDEATSPNRSPYRASGNRDVSKAAGDIRNQSTETQRLREELSLHAVARASREIPIERLVKSRLHQRLILLTDPTAPECEQYRTLRTQLFHAAEKRQTQVVVITSALAGEGKTSTTLNLALAIAQSKESRALVIDGDLRRPNIASYLGIHAKTGLSEVLKGEIDTLEPIVCLDEPELYLLPISRETLNPTELLSSERLAETIRQLRDYFDFILIDSPPVLPFADARLLSNIADAVILVIRAESAPYETVEKAVEALPTGRILGVVLNDAERVRETDYYDYYYSYTQRQERRRTLLGRLLSRARDSWLGRKMKL